MPFEWFPQMQPRHTYPLHSLRAPEDYGHCRHLNVDPRIPACSSLRQAAGRGKYHGGMLSILDGGTPADFAVRSSCWRDCGRSLVSHSADIIFSWEVIARGSTRSSPSTLTRRQTRAWNAWRMVRHYALVALSLLPLQSLACESDAPQWTAIKATLVTVSPHC